MGQELKYAHIDHHFQNGGKFPHQMLSKWHGIFHENKLIQRLVIEGIKTFCWLAAGWLNEDFFCFFFSESVCYGLFWEKFMMELVLFYFFE